MEKQGIFVNGILANIQEKSHTKDNVTDFYNVLQVTVLGNNGLSLIDIKDSEKNIKKDLLNKSVSLSVQYSIFNGKAFFRLD